MESAKRILEATLSLHSPDLEALEVALMALPESVFITDRKGHITYVNSGFTEQTGFERVEAIGATPRILSSHLMPAGFMEQLWMTILSGKRWRGRILNRRIGHSSFANADERHASIEGLYWVEADITPVFGENAQIKMFVAIERDITDLVRSEEAAATRESALQLKSEIAEVLHAAAPLEQRLLRALELVSSIEDAEELRRCRVLGVGADGSELSVLAELGEPVAEDCSVHALLQNERIVVVDDCPAQGEAAHGHYLVPLQHAGECLGVLCIDSALEPNRAAERLDLLRHVGAQITLALTSARAQEQLEVARRKVEAIELAKTKFLTSMGHGLRTPMHGILGMTQLLQRTVLSEEQREFARGITDSADGLLALINELLVESQSAVKQTCARLQQSCSSSAATTSIDEVGSLRLQLPETDEASVSGLHVLLADDNEVNLTVASKMLERLGCTYSIATNGKEAVRLALESSFDLVLMDVHMPVLDGLDATRNIRDALGYDLPIVAMSTMVTKADRLSCYGAGMNDYLGKPVRLEDLKTLLASVRSAA